VNGKTIISFKLDNTPPLIFDNRLGSQLHSANHGQIVDDSVSLGEKRKTGHIEHQYGTFNTELIPYFGFESGSFFGIRILGEVKKVFVMDSCPGDDPHSRS